MDYNRGQGMVDMARPRTLETSIIPVPSQAPEHSLRLSNQHNERQTSQNLGSGGQIGATSKAMLIGVLSAFGSTLFVLIILGLIYFLRYTSRGRILLDKFGRPGEYDDEQAFAKEEAEALEEMDDIQRAEYMRAKAFTEANPPESAQTDISLSQFLAIQEKGVSAWEFEPALEIANCFVEGRTEIEFFDTECSVQTNLPVPKQNEVYYWEAKIFDKPDTTSVGIGFTTKPYPLFRMPGYHKTSVAYLSPGTRRFNQPFTPTSSYGPPYVRGDVIGVGYRPRTGTVFFTRNGKKLDDITHTLKTQNLFPTVGATGPATVHVNFGQMGFVYIEANVKKWGLAPAAGSLAPPPPYGSEQGSILLDQGQHGVREGEGMMGNWGGSPATAAGLTPAQRHGRSRSAQVRLARHQIQRSPGPQRSPTDISLAQLEFESEDGDDADMQAAYAASRAASGTSMSGALGSSSGGSAPPGTQPQEIPNLPQGQNQSQGLGLLDVAQPPPEYSSPVDRSILSARRDAERQQQQRHPPRTSSRRHQKQRQLHTGHDERQPGQHDSPASRSQARRTHRQRRDYFDTSSASPSSASNSGSGDERDYDSQPESPFAGRQRRRDDRRRRRKKRHARFYADSPEAAGRRSAEVELYKDEPEAGGQEGRYHDQPEEEEDVTPRPPTQDRSPPVPYEVAVGQSVPDDGDVGPSGSQASR